MGTAALSAPCAGSFVSAVSAGEAVPSSGAGDEPHAASDKARIPAKAAASNLFCFIMISFYPC